MDRHHPRPGGPDHRAAEVVAFRYLQTLDNHCYVELLDSDHVIYIDIVDSRRGVRLAASRGDRDRIPLHGAAQGDHGAAAQERVRDLLDQTDLVSARAITITGIEGHFEELTKVCKQGYALVDRENEDDGRCVTAPLLGTHLPAAISLCGPSSRFSLQDPKRAGKTRIEVASGIATR